MGIGGAVRSWRMMPFQIGIGFVLVARRDRAVGGGDLLIDYLQVSEGRRNAWERRRNKQD